MFSKILIANRGEIAVRIIRACKEMGISTVGVFSEADRESLHVSLADESYCIGGARSADSYLRQEAVLSAALASGAEAIHPGYGFLSENESFARLCTQHGVVFIGPDADTIAKMGDKEQAKRTMREAGVPVIPGCDLVTDVAQAQDEATRIGFPLLIKARAGGGGRGIRRVDSLDDVVAQFAAAEAEAEACFGDGAVYMERLLAPVKHVEMQILADTQGHVVCLGERDCSLQRKNQKLLEESPAVRLPDAVRCAMQAASVAAGQAAKYHGAGTIEYLYDPACEQFYFMEMNTRLQVEHPVTEMSTGIDLVKWQIRIAAGLPLDFAQEDILCSGHTIECRINAENPYQNFRPSAGRVDLLHIPGGPCVRFDTAIYQGYAIPPFYDSMIGKLIVHAKTRDEAIRKMKAALCELIVEGVETTAAYQEELLSGERFVEGSYCVGDGIAIQKRRAAV